MTSSTSFENSRRLASQGLFASGTPTVRITSKAPDDECQIPPIRIVMARMRSGNRKFVSIQKRMQTRDHVGETVINQAVIKVFLVLEVDVDRSLTDAAAAAISSRRTLWNGCSEKSLIAVCTISLRLFSSRNLMAGRTDGQYCNVNTVGLPQPRTQTHLPIEVINVVAVWKTEREGRREWRPRSLCVPKLAPNLVGTG